MIHINDKNSFELTANLETSAHTQEPLERKVSLLLMNIPCHLRDNIPDYLTNTSIEDEDTSRALEVFKQVIDRKVQLDKKETYTRLPNVCTEKQNEGGGASVRFRGAKKR